MMNRTHSLMKLTRNLTVSFCHYFFYAKYVNVYCQCPANVMLTHICDAKIVDLNVYYIC